jgi:hypothetical protein
MKNILLLLCVTFLVGCDSFMGRYTYEVGECYASERWDNAFVIEKVLDYGVIVNKIEREGLVYIKLPKENEQSRAYLTFRLFREMYYERIDCALVQGQ